MDAESGHVPAYCGGHTLHQIGVERRRPGNRRWIHGGSVAGEASQALLVDESGNPQTRGVQDYPLLPDQLVGAPDRSDRCAAIDPGEMPQSMTARLLQGW